MDEIPILDLRFATSNDASQRQQLLSQLHYALFHVGFLYVKNHGIDQDMIDNLVNILPDLFNLPQRSKQQLSKINSPHFLGYNGYAEESTLGKLDLREQFDFATELPVIYDASIPEWKPYWRLQGPNQWPEEDLLPGFKQTLTRYHDAVADLSYRFVRLIEEAFGIPIGIYDIIATQKTVGHPTLQHRIKLLKYPPVAGDNVSRQGVGPHKDSSGWLTFLYQPPHPEGGLYVLSQNNSWIHAPPIPGTFVVNMGNAFEAATAGAARATVHKVEAPRSQTRYSIPFFMGLPLNMRVSEIKAIMPEGVRKEGEERARQRNDDGVSPFLDPRWDSLGESQLRKWIRSHQDVGRKWYGDELCEYYLG